MFRLRSFDGVLEGVLNGVLDAVLEGVPEGVLGGVLIGIAHPIIGVDGRRVVDDSFAEDGGSGKDGTSDGICPARSFIGALTDGGVDGVATSFSVVVGVMDTAGKALSITLRGVSGRRMVLIVSALPMQGSVSYARAVSVSSALLFDPTFLWHTQRAAAKTLTSNRRASAANWNDLSLSSAGCGLAV